MKSVSRMAYRWCFHMFSKKSSRIPTKFYLFGGCYIATQWVTRNGCLSLPLETQVLPVGGIPAMAWYMGNHRSHGDLAVKMGQIPEKLLLSWRKWWESSGGNGVQDFQTHPLVGKVTFWTFWTTRFFLGILFETTPHGSRCFSCNQLIISIHHHVMGFPEWTTG